MRTETSPKVSVKVSQLQNLPSEYLDTQSNLKKEDKVGTDISEVLKLHQDQLTSFV